MWSICLRRYDLDVRIVETKTGSGRLVSLELLGQNDCPVALDTGPQGVKLFARKSIRVVLVFRFYRSKIKAESARIDSLANGRSFPRGKIKARARDGSRRRFCSRTTFPRFAREMRGDARRRDGRACEESDDSRDETRSSEGNSARAVRKRGAI